MNIWKMSHCLPYEPFGGDINLKVDLCNFAKKADLENATEIILLN